MREFNTREAEGNYSITFETDDRKAFEKVQEFCRMLIDGKDCEAIPVEWLEQHIKELDTELQSLYSHFRSQGDSKEKNEALLRCVELRTMLRPYETVLSEWRKENE